MFRQKKKRWTKLYVWTKSVVDLLKSLMLREHELHFIPLLSCVGIIAPLMNSATVLERILYDKHGHLLWQIWHHTSTKVCSFHYAPAIVDCIPLNIQNQKPRFSYSGNYFHFYVDLKCEFHCCYLNRGWKCFVTMCALSCLW